MKRLLSVLSFAFFAACAFAQDVQGFHIGGRFGLGESSLSGTGLNVRPKLAISGGIATNYQFTNIVGLNADFLLTSTGARASGSTRTSTLFGAEKSYTYQEKYDLVNIEVPLSLQAGYWFGDFMLKAFAGPAMNFNLMALHTRAYDDPAYQSNDYQGQRLDNMNNVSYYMMYGIGAGALSKNGQVFFLDLRFNNGISPVGTINNAGAYTNYYTVGAGYIF
jgi:hypothetical protein